MTYTKPEGTRWAGRPSISWLSCIEKDLRIHGWETKALDRNLWRRTMEEVKTYTEL
jgi:hypothetical protein